MEVIKTHTEDFEGNDLDKGNGLKKIYLDILDSNDEAKKLVEKLQLKPIFI